jgi:hypothetical protein
MKLKDILFISLLFIILYWLFKHKFYDYFTVYSSNASYIKDIFPSQLDIQTNKIKSLLEKQFTENDSEYDINKIDKNSWQQFSFYQNFIYEKNFKEICLDNLKNILSNDFPNIELISTKEFDNIYWKDISNNRHFIFDMTVSSKNYGFTRIFSIYLILNNINNYLLDDGSYIANLNNSDLLIKFIKENTLNTENLEILPPKSPFYYYEIKNKLHLMDPFLSSGKEMQITEELQTKFQDVLSKKEESLKKYSTGNCFDSENNILFSGPNSQENILKCESQDPSYKWDTVPFSDFECPFYNKNTNYPNNFGKLINDKCVLPLNMKLQGYKYYLNNPEYAPLCYNCKTDLINENSSLGKCCDKQLNQSEYPELSSPDYAYENDNLLRKKYKNMFEEKSLKIN